MCQTSWVNYDQLSHKSSCHRRKLFLFLLPGLPNCEQWHLAKGGALESAGRICHKHLDEETTLTASSSFTLFSETTRTFAHCMVTFFSYIQRYRGTGSAMKAFNLSALNHPVMCLFPSHLNEPKLFVENRDANASAVADCICICHGFQEC